MNKVILLGNLTRDPEIRYSQSAEPIAVANFSLAVSRRFKREGEPDVDFINCVTFGKQAEFMEKYFKKGMKAAVSGRLVVRSYDDNTGQKRWVTEVRVDEVDFVESKAAYEARVAQQGQYQGRYDSTPDQYTPPGDPSGYAPSTPPPPKVSAPEGFTAITESIDDDDLPF